MEIILSPGAEKRLKKLPKLDQIAVAKKVRSLVEEFVSSREEKLKGYKDIFRVRVGDYRIVYQRTRERVYVVLIGHRRDVYQLFRRLFD
jgi:mRNA interferase RelE/StbE